MNGRRVCEGCGCTEANACLHPETGLPCSWVEGYAGDLCSVCAEVILALPQTSIDDDDPPEPNEPRVELYSPHEAQQYIEATRAARMGAGA